MNNIIFTGTLTLGLLILITGPLNFIYTGYLARSTPVFINIFTAYVIIILLLSTSLIFMPLSTALINFSSGSFKSV